MRYLTASIFLGSTVTEKWSIFSIRDIMVFMTDLGTYSTHPYPIIHLTGMTVIPVLVHEVFLGDGKSTQLVAQWIFILIKDSKICYRITVTTSTIHFGNVIPCRKKFLSFFGLTIYLLTTVWQQGDVKILNIVNKKFWVIVFTVAFTILITVVTLFQ